MPAPCAHNLHPVVWLSTCTLNGIKDFECISLMHPEGDGELFCQLPAFAPVPAPAMQLDYDLAELELSSSFISERPPEGQHALAGLDGLQLLAANIHALVRHAAYPGLTQLSNLRELHIDMVGNLDNTCISAGGGLPWLQHLTRLVMTLAHKVRGDSAAAPSQSITSIYDCQCVIKSPTVPQTFKPPRSLVRVPSNNQ